VTQPKEILNDKIELMKLHFFCSMIVGVCVVFWQKVKEFIELFFVLIFKLTFNVVE
jgi:hypothetical protein